MYDSWAQSSSGHSSLLQSCCVYSQTPKLLESENYILDGK